MLSRTGEGELDDIHPQCNLENLPPSVLKWLDGHNHDIVILFNTDGKMIYASKSIQRKLGYGPNDLIGMYWYELISPEDESYINVNYRRDYYHTQTFNIRIKDKIGKWNWFDVTATKQSAEKGVVFAVILKDIADQKEAEELMIRSEKMSVAGQLAAGIAHEIRNPLTSLKGFIQLMQGGLTQKEEYYKIMLEEIDKMESITSELLFISKPLSNDDFQTESISSMIRDVMHLLRAQGKIRNITINWEQYEDTPLYCNRSQIKQVLINLIKNAIEAMEEKGTIEISLYRTGAFIYIDVIDEGPGIPEEIIHKLTEPFFTTKSTGTGLGLMISNQILKKHNGTLNILSNQNQGSTFRMIFPTH